MTSVPKSHPPPGRSPREGVSASVLAIVVLGLLFVAAILWLAVLRPRNLEQAARQADSAAKTAERRLKDSAGRTQRLAQVNRELFEAAETGESIVDDPSGKLLWASPTHYSPLTLEYVPAGTLCIVYSSPQLFIQSGEGEKVLAALGPWGRQLVDRLQALAGARLGEIERVLAAIVVRRGDAIDAVLRIHLNRPWTTEELVQRFPHAKASRIGEQDVLMVGDRVAFLTPAEGVPGLSRLVVCPADMAAELIAQADDPPLLVRDIEDLVAHTDVGRNLTIIVSTKFLEAGGAHLVEGDAQPLREAFASFVGREATAASLSACWDQRYFFVELRAAPALSTSPRWLATTLHQRLEAAAGEVGTLVAQRTWPAYGRKVIERFPAMLKRLAAATRHGEDDRQAMLNAYLPEVAGHNLLMGAELVLSQREGGAEGATATGAAELSIEQRLAANASLVFPKETLQRAIELWGDEVGVATSVDGPALQADGITQNQTLALDERDRPAGDILVKILRLANPDRAAESAADPRQKLVYYVEKEAGGGGRIIVTTRAAATAAGAALPAAFGGWKE